MIYISNRSAWMEIASAFSTSTGAKAKIRNVTVEGICEAIAHLWIVKAISGDQRKEMLSAVRKHHLYVPGFYIWRNNKEGAKQRVQFCQMQAEPVKVRRRKKALERTR